MQGRLSWPHHALQNQWMIVARAKLLLRIVGVALLLLGLMCLPSGSGISPKRDLSAFNNLADAGLFLRVGLVVTTGGALLVAAWILPGRNKNPKDAS